MPMIHLTVSNAAEFLEFTKRAFGAVEKARHQMPNTDKIMHASIEIGGEHMMINDHFTDHQGNCKPASELGGTPLVIELNFPNADEAFERALAAGATVKYPLMDQFWGQRYGQVTDPFGNFWGIAADIEKVSEEELARRAANLGM